MKTAVRQLMRRGGAIVMTLVLLLTQACGLLQAIPGLPGTVGAELERLLTRLDQSVSDYDQLIANQRIGLAQDMQGVIDSASLNLHMLTEQAHSSVQAVLATVQDIEENTVADLSGLINEITAKSERLIAALQSGVDSTIRTAARELDRQRAVTLLQMNTIVQAALRPAIAQLTRVSGVWVGQVSNSVNTWIVRSIGGSLLLIGGVALLIGLRRKLRALAIGAGVVAALGIPLTVAAAPVARIAAPTTEVPSGADLCDNMSTLEETLERFEKPKPKPKPPSIAEDLPTKVDKVARSFAWVSQKLRAGTHAASTSPGLHQPMRVAEDDAVDRPRAAADSDKEQVASEVLRAASECLTYAPNATYAAKANRTLTRAMALISEKVFCSFMADCEVLGKACDERLQICMAWGDYCEKHEDCALDMACDFGKRRCVDATTACTTPNDCRPEYACSPQVGKCLSVVEVRNRAEACDTDAPANSPCRVGKLDVVDRWVKCVQTTSAVNEVCDGVDNDCNGTIDEGQSRPPGCDVGAGECQKRGTWACTNGQMVCTQATAQPESCNHLDDDCDGQVDNVPVEACDNAPAHGECRKGHRTCGACIASAPREEVCDGLDNNCDGIADPAPLCQEVEIRRQGSDDNGGEMTEKVSLPTDLINTTKVHGPSECGVDEHGRRLVRTSAEVWADSPHGATCTLSGPFSGYLTADPHDCRIQVHYKTVRLGSNVWCNGVWRARAVGAYLF